MKLKRLLFDVSNQSENKIPIVGGILTTRILFCIIYLTSSLNGGEGNFPLPVVSATFIKKSNSLKRQGVNMKLLLTDAERITGDRINLMNLQSFTSYCDHCGSRNITTYSHDDLDAMA